MQKSSVRKFLKKIQCESVRRSTKVETIAMGVRRVFHAYDFGPDTLVFERDVWKSMDEHASVLVAEKNDLCPGTFGHLITVTGGNHSVAALPLLSGKFWDLCDLPMDKRSDVMMHSILVGNVVDGKLELSQRDVPCAKLVVLDDWLVKGLGFGLDDVVMVERNDETLQYFRERGLEWRVKPLAWSEVGIKAAVAQSRKKISSSLVYYHSVKGVHFLSWPEFHRMASLASTDFKAFKTALAELVDIYEGNETSFARQPKFHGHHEIEFFGLMRGSAIEKIVPRLEELFADIETEPDRAPGRIAEIDTQFRELLTRPEFADENSTAFAESLYMNLTGEVYAVSGEGAAIAFDDRRTALPGATFINGAPQYHPGADARTEVLLANVKQVLSKDEFIEYANIYELRTEESEDAQNLALGKGLTREIVFKTNCRPLTLSYVEKRLSSITDGYGAYVLARIEGFKAIGVNLPEYRLLRHQSFGSRKLIYDYYIRTRCEGEPLSVIPANLISDSDAQEKVAYLMGDAAAQNLVMKKYDAEIKSALYGIGKEIYRFAWDSERDRIMPNSVSTCSIRGTCAWPDLSCTEKNFHAVAKFYMREYADSFNKQLQEWNVQPANRTILGERFFAGFESRTRALLYRYKRQREELIRFSPPIPEKYRFAEKGLFVMRSLQWQAEHLDVFRELFFRFMNGKGIC